MAWSAGELVQRGHHFAIVDEVDSILIDEARTPLIISGPAEHSASWYGEFAAVVGRLQKGKDGEGDYEVDEAKRTIAITERGVARVEDRLGIDNLYESVNTPLVGYLNNAIKAKELYKRDKDYIVNESGEVLIVDEFTGRILHGRRYNEGMHQAIEAKEGVEVKQENQTLATITLQNYFRLYDKLGGMTGTAQTEAGEFNSVYKVGVVSIPTHRPMIRVDHPDVIYKTEKAKFNAVIEDIAERHATGQPVLVGTVSVENSEILSTLLRRRGIPHSVLNAKFHAQEADDHRAGRSQGRRHGGHQHGRSRYRHPARRQPRVPGVGRAAPARPRPGGVPRGVRQGARGGPAELEGSLRRRGGRGHRAPAACTSSAPSATTPAASTTSCAAGPAGRATRASPASTCPCRTT